MNPISHPSNNTHLAAPADWDQERRACQSIPVTVYEEDGLTHIVSFWKPTAEQIEALVEGKSVALVILGGAMPPVILAVEK